MIVNYEYLPIVRKDHRDSRIVFAGGCYDLVHEGHVEGLEWRRDLGDILVVGISSDERIELRKGPGRPIRPELGRLAVVAAFRAVDYAFIMPMPAEVSPTMQVLHSLKPDVFVDYQDNKGRWPPETEEYIRSLGVEFIYDDQPKRDSTSDIIERVRRTMD